MFLTPIRRTGGKQPLNLFNDTMASPILAAGQQPALSASYMAAEPAAEPGSPPSPGARWSMPTKFLPPPDSFIPAAGAAASKVIDLHQKSHAQLLAMAAKHHKRLGLPDDPFQAVLAGIPDRAKLRPDSQVASTFTLGSVPTDSPYAKAWRAIKRPAPRGSARSSAAEAVAAKARQPHVTSVEGDAPFVDVPPLAHGAPVLDMNRLFLERDAELGELLAAVYDCYLHPLELDLPLMFRPARNIDHLESQTKLRGQLGCRWGPAG
eukprot:gene6727-6947_t